MTEQYQPILQQCPLFDGIGEEERVKMLRCLDAKIAEYDKKSVIFAQGSPARQIGVVLTGNVQMIRIDYYGNRSILAESTAAEVFGEAFACGETDSLPVSVIAGESCRILLLDCRHVLHTCKNTCGFHQRLIYNLMKNLASQTLAFHRRMEITSKRTTREKLMTYLMMQAQKAGSNRFRIPFDRQELADYLEVDRSGLSTEIGKLRREGVLKSVKNEFTLL